MCMCMINMLRYGVSSQKYSKWTKHTCIFLFVLAMNKLRSDQLNKLLFFSVIEQL